MHTIFHARDIKYAIAASDDFIAGCKLMTWQVQGGSPGGETGRSSVHKTCTHKLKPLTFGPATTAEEIIVEYLRYSTPDITAEFKILGEYEEPLRYAMIENVLFDLLSFSSESQRTIRFVVPLKPSPLFSLLLKRSIERYPDSMFVVATSSLTYVAPRSKFMTVAVKSPTLQDDDSSDDIAKRFLAEVAKDLKAENWNKVFSIAHATSFRLCATSIDVATLAKSFIKILGKTLNDERMRDLVRQCARIEASKTMKVSLAFDSLLLGVLMPTID